MLEDKISITGISSISPLGETLEDIWLKYKQDDHCLTKELFDGSPTWLGRLTANSLNKIKEIKGQDSKYKNLDNSVLYAIHVARNAVEMSGWSGKKNQKKSFGINIGSSRGATTLFENFHADYIKTRRTASLASPTTTMGNISSWVAHDLGITGPEFSHSITCSTALHALLNGVAWLRSGMTDKFLVGGSEAPLTGFTIAQMKALKIYSTLFSDDIEVSNNGQNFPCRALDFAKKENTMVLSEGASMVCLENGLHKKSLAVIEGVGYATEALEHNVSISSDAKCFQKSMAMALKSCPKEEVDVIVMHAPGTIKGDLSEYKAIQKIFPSKFPFLTTNKWKLGHSFGASGMLSVEMAILMLKHQEAISIPFFENTSSPEQINKVLVNAVGFGGNAVSVLLSKV